MKLKGKTALITGSSAGIGAGIAKGMAAEGADIIVNYCHNADGAEITAEAVRRTGRKALVVQADVSKAEDVHKMFDKIAEAFGRLDILVNNAGITPRRPFGDCDEEYWDKLLGINLKSVYLCCKRALPLMPRGAVILNISSIHATTTTYNFALYAASKGGMEALTRSLAIELGDKQIRVNAIRPGWINVERDRSDPSDPSYKLVTERIPIHRLGGVEDVVPSAILLCSDESGFTTGAVLPIDGGAGFVLNSPFPKGYVEGGAVVDEFHSLPGKQGAKNPNAE